MFLRKLSILTSLLATSAAALCVAAPSTAEQQDAALYVMPGGFVVGLGSGETAMLSVALELTGDRRWLSGIEQDRVRGVVTRSVAGQSGRRLVSDAGRRALAARLERDIRSAGLPVASVLIPDLAVS
jgi:hypothetical protein